MCLNCYENINNFENPKYKSSSDRFIPNRKAMHIDSYWQEPTYHKNSPESLISLY